MFLIGLACVLLLVASTLIHYESLRVLNFSLPRLDMPARIKVVLVILGAFVGHTLEVLLHTAVFYWLARHQGLGTIDGTNQPAWTSCLYFAATTYTSLGLGDVVAAGPLRLLAGSTSLTGLLLIGWTAAYVYISMERFWEVGAKSKAP
jgi:hypothetical protein